MRVLVDTNVLISGIFWPGNAKRVLNAIRAGQITFLTSPDLLQELRAVLIDASKPFRLHETEAQAIVDAVTHIATIIHPRTTLAMCRDEADNRVLECAMEGNATYIVTGDKDLLSLRTIEDIRICSISEFLDLLE